ncbi:MAG: hypothetical protein ACX932_04455 [Gammaproteobacteria bacterium]
MNRSVCSTYVILTTLALGLTGCASTYDPEPASTSMHSDYSHNRHATCVQLQSKLRQLGYDNSDVVSMSDSRAAATIVAYKANGCEK